MSEKINPYVSNIFHTSIRGLTDADTILYASDDMRLVTIQMMSQNFLMELQTLGIRISAFQINETQVLSIREGIPKITLVDQEDELSDDYLSLKQLKQVFGLELNINEFNLS